ncbi:MAG: amidohydrolase [Ignavibacteriaceae bacterium]|nr:amidohydrolase [Ignavibacteriaceae bacterium]
MKNLLNNLFVIIFVAVLLPGCTNQQKLNSADFVLMNGVIYTVDSVSSIKQAVAITGRKFVFVGSNSEVKAFIGEQTKVIDLQEKLVLPGFIDSHCHVISSYRYFFEVNLYGLKTTEEIQNKIREYIAANKDAKYVKGRGWSNTDFPKTGPDKKILDEVSTELPMSFSSEDGHSRWVNSKTLEIANITKKTITPDGGIIEHDKKTGEPTGTLRENAADLVSKVFPDYSVDQLITGIKAYQKMALAFGITTAHDAYLDSWSNEITAFRKMEKENMLSIRFRASLYVDSEKETEQINLLVKERNRNTGELFKTNGAKIFIDGVVEGGTAYLKQPYKHLPGSYGKLLWKIDDLNKVCSELDKNKFQIHVHSIGDAATSVALDVFAYAEKINGKRESRNMITHLQLVSPDDILRFKELGVAAIPQPYWFQKDDYYYNIQVPYLGQQRAGEEYPMKSFFDAGVVVASSSDYPVTIPCNPLRAIQIGITREKIGETNPSEVLWGDEKVTLKQMIRSFTINGAYANFLENSTGSIEKGKSADIIILNKNLFEVPPAEISTAKVLTTFFRGKEVYVDSSMAVSSK